MSDFQIHFTYPWLLLLLIPAVVLTLIPYFRSHKKYRRNRNKITSIVLHLIVVTLAIFALSGMTFGFSVPNRENEVLLLVDVSHSSRETKAERDAFVKAAIEENGDNFKIGVVTFGYGQVYAAPISGNTDGLYEQYLEAPLPDTSATDIASALQYARGLFANPETAKIVLISDGAETDGNASSAVKAVAADGIRVDTVRLLPDRHDEVEILSFTTPDYTIAVGDEFTIGLTLQSSYRGAATITLYDNDVKSDTQFETELTGGTQTVEITHKFDLPGMHVLRVSIESEGDTLNENNGFYSYLNLEVYDRVLILERYEDESAPLREILGAQYETVDCVTVSDFDNIPKTLDELLQYDQIVFVNIANADLKEIEAMSSLGEKDLPFDEVLEQYVNAGGGLFTVGGNKRDELDEQGNPVANTYNMNDMTGSLYQDLLPVQAIDYTPPVGVMIIIDRSDSMAQEIESPSGARTNKLEIAKQSALSALNALTARDWCGVMTLEDNYEEKVALSRVSSSLSELRAAIDDVEIGGGTVYTGAIEAACSALRSLGEVERKHVVFITDGEASDDPALYQERMKLYYDNSGITLSVFTVQAPSETVVANMTALAKAGGGQYHNVLRFEELPELVKSDLNVPEIKAYNPEPFTPTIRDHTAVVNGIDEQYMPSLGGFYGTRAKVGVEIPLMGEYVPVYAQWKYGKGTVGSFMCDLEGIWSREFLQSDVGVRLILNIVGGIFPREDIRPKLIETEFTEDNYTTLMSIFTELDKGGSVEVTITSPPDEATGLVRTETLIPDSDSAYSRLTFTVTQPGVHEVVVRRKDAEGNVTAEVTTYKTFSYSREYEVFRDGEVCAAFLEELAAGGRGTTIEKPWEIFETFVKTLQRSFDPRILFMIIALVLFLLDVAVRKFKFKWPHEIVRDRKIKKRMEEAQGRRTPSEKTHKEAT